MSHAAVGVALLTIAFATGGVANASRVRFDPPASSHLQGNASRWNAASTALENRRLPTPRNNRDSQLSLRIRVAVSSRSGKATDL